MRTTFLGLLVCLLACGTASIADAQGIFKCVDSGTTSYQGTPCADGQIETPMKIGAPPPRPESDTRTPVAAAVAPPPAQATPRATVPWRRTTLTLGMSDDEVLNIPGWGRPARITRARAPRAWREEWVYGQSATGTRHLVFVNARLVDIVDQRPVEQVARLTLQ